jgi:hypothetical protein
MWWLVAWYMLVASWLMNVVARCLVYGGRWLVGGCGGYLFIDVVAS